MATPIWKLFVFSCPKCGSEDLRRKSDHVGCASCGAWVYRVVNGEWVELEISSA